MVQRNALPLHAKIGSKADELIEILGYGVMVTLQILVLSFLVRVRVSQQGERVEFSTLFFCFIQ